MTARDGTARPGAADAGLATLLGLAAAVLYRLVAADRFGFDGPQLATAFALRPETVHWHVLYLPLAHGLRGLVGWGDMYEPLRLLGALGGGVGVAASALAARLLGLPRPAAFAGAALVAVSPHVWFFASVVEVHALHFAVVALAVCATLLAPWRRPSVALPIAALAYGATWLGHATAPLLGPGWIALVALARARVARPFGTRTLLLGVGPALLAGLALVAVPVRWWQSEPGRLPIDVRIVRSYASEGDSLRFLTEGLLVPLGLLLPVVALGLVATRRRAAAAALAALLVPPTLFFVWWGIPEGGGYTTGHGVLHAVAAALAFERLGGRRRAALVGSLLALQASLSVFLLLRFDRHFDPAERVALVDELRAATAIGDAPPPATLVTLAFQAPSITVERPDVEQLDLVGRLLGGYRAGLAPEALVEDQTPMLGALLLERTLLLDLTDADHAWSHADPAIQAYVRAFEARLLERLPHLRGSRDGWELVVFEAPAGAAPR